MQIRNSIFGKYFWSAIGIAGCLAASVCADELTVDFRPQVTATEVSAATVTLAIANDYHFSSLEIAISAKNGSGGTESFGDANGYGLRVWGGDDRWWDTDGNGEQLRFVFTVRDQNNDRVSAKVHVHSLFYRRAAGAGSRVLFDGGDAGELNLLIAGGSSQTLSEPYVVNTGDSLVLTRSGTDQIFQLAGMVVSFSESDSSSQSVIQLSDPTISTHLFTAGVMRLGITDNGGGFVNHVSVDGGATDLMATEAAYGRGWQGSVRDTLHGGRYNPTQAGFRDLAGAPVTLAEEDGRLKILSYNMPLYSDAVFDFTEHEDLAPDYEKYNDGLNESSGAIGDPYTGDTDALDEPADWTQDDEVRSEFDFEGFYENAVSQAGGQVSAVRFFQRYSYMRDPGPIYQFGPGALRMDGGAVYNASVITSSGDISSTLAGVQTATAVDMAGVIFTSYGIRFTAANGYVNKMWYSGGEWHAEAMDLGNENVNYKLPGSGITPTEADPLDYGFLMVTDGTNPSTSHGFALYVPMTEVNRKCAVGINKADGSVAYREDRLTDCKILYNSSTPTQVSIRARYNLRGLLTPAHGDPAVYEALESDQYVLYGTPNEILAAVQALEAELQSGAGSVHGTPTSWLEAYGLDDEEGDADGDGSPNWSEYLAGTSPVIADEGQSLIILTPTGTAGNVYDTAAFLNDVVYDSSLLSGVGGDAVNSLSGQNDPYVVAADGSGITPPASPSLWWENGWVWTSGNQSPRTAFYFDIQEAAAEERFALQSVSVTLNGVADSGIRMRLIYRTDGLPSGLNRIDFNAGANMTSSGTYSIDLSAANLIWTDSSTPLLDGTWFRIAFYDPSTGDNTSGTAVIERVQIRAVRLASYAQWRDGFGLDGSNAAADVDAEGDGLDNLLEYALGGNPTNSDAAGLLNYRMVDSGGATEFEYVFRRRLDAEERGLVYDVTRSTNVVLSGWTVDGIVETSGAIDDEFESVTNRTAMDLEPMQFMKLDVSLDE